MVHSFHLLKRETASTVPEEQVTGSPDVRTSLPRSCLDGRSLSQDRGLHHPQTILCLEEATKRGGTDSRRYRLLGGYGLRLLAPQPQASQRLSLSLGLSPSSTTRRI